jgi:hypothetical protein
MERLPSIDFETDLPPSTDNFVFPCPPPVTVNTNYISNGINNTNNNNDFILAEQQRLAGTELSKVTSFDYAAASVSAPPLRSFKSFDASYYGFSPEPSLPVTPVCGVGNADIDCSYGSQKGFVTDRVTDKVALSQNGVNDSVALSLPSLSSKRKTVTMNLHDEYYEKKQRNDEGWTPSNGLNADSSVISPESQDTAQFINYLNQNQNVSPYCLINFDVRVLC